MTLVKRADRLLKKVGSIIAEVDRASADNFIQTLLSSKRVFFAGAGRSGLAAKAFAMRLMHLGLHVYVVGETVTPSICEGDCLVIVSGSGQTSSLVSIANAAAKRNAKVATITSNSEAPIAKMCCSVVVIKGRSQPLVQPDYDARQIEGFTEPIAPLGTLFELSTTVFFEAVVEEMMVRVNKTEEHLRALHTNLE